MITGKIKKVGLVLLACSALTLAGAKVAKLAKQWERQSLREKVHNIVGSYYGGDYRTNINGKSIRVYTGSGVPLSERHLWVEVKSEKGRVYFYDYGKYGPYTDQCYFGELNCYSDEIENPEKEFDNILKCIRVSLEKS